MNILIVDDQKAVLDGLCSGIDWAAIGIDQVYTALSAREARLMLVNFDIHILLTDIEMPEEDGISLFRWVKEKYPSVVGIFLTSHADFDYAREALQMGSFDYILQPARYEEVTRVVEAAGEKVRENSRIERLEHAGKVLEEQRDGLLELLIIKAQNEKWNECRELFAYMQASEKMSHPECVSWSAVVQISRFAKRTSPWSEKLLKMVFRNVLEELLADVNARVCVAQENLEEYLMMTCVDDGAIDVIRWERTMQDFIQFINDHMDFQIALYPENCVMREFLPERYAALNARKAANIYKKPEIFWDDVAEVEQDINAERIASAEKYIRDNISRNFSRADVAEHLHLNEEYFSRLFRKYTGYTYKDYEMKVRMDQARKMLEHSRISVSIIASKVGFDNFSHFSRAFKKEVGMTPQEYRKERTGK